MGWTSGDGGRRKVVAEMQEPSESWQGTLTQRCLKHHAHGEEDWFMYEQTKETRTGVEITRYILVTIWDGDYHKEMESSMHPYYYGCPVAWLDEVPQQPGASEAEWRARVRIRAGVGSGTGQDGLFPALS